MDPRYGESVVNFKQRVVKKVAHSGVVYRLEMQGLKRL